MSRLRLRVSYKICSNEPRWPLFSRGWWIQARTKTTSRSTKGFLFRRNSPCSGSNMTREWSISSKSLCSRLKKSKICKTRSINYKKNRAPNTNRTWKISMKTSPSCPSSCNHTLTPRREKIVWRRTTTISLAKESWRRCHLRTPWTRLSRRTPATGFSAITSHTLITTTHRW